MNSPWMLAAVCLVLTVPAVRAQPAPAQKEEDRILAGQVRVLFKKHCHRCHGIEFEIEGLNVLDRKSLTADYLTPGKPEDSLLYKVVKNNRMPPRKVLDRPTPAEVELLEKWVKAGAPDYPVVAARPFVSIKANHEAIRDHLRSLNAASRPFQRYFTLTHLHNNPNLSEEDLRGHRAALSKVLNSLSWKARIVLPQEIDKQQTVLAIDIRDLDWDQNEVWRAILREYPYGLSYSTHRDSKLREINKEIDQLSDCELVHVRSDWFVATASRPPLYHHLLKIPNYAKMLEQKLDVDIPANFQNNKLKRAGFATSGVSGQNRLVERHESKYGAYWKSYDFKQRAPRGNLMRFPLGPVGPLFPGNTYTRQAFQHDGGEIIFSLPNHLQGYMLVDGKDSRIDAGPIVVVSDALKTSGTPEIVNGLSCMACHKRGVIRFRDLVRKGNAVEGTALDKVEELYPEMKDWEQPMQDDENRFLAALNQATGRYLRVGKENQGKKIEEFGEPVQEVARVYRLVDLNAETVAHELGLEKPADLEARIRSGDKILRRLGLEPLGNGGAIKREDWESIDGSSVFQLTAHALGLGSPYNVR